MSTMRLGREQFNAIYHTLKWYQEVKTAEPDICYMPGNWPMTPPLDVCSVELKPGNKILRLIRIWNVKNHRAWTARYPDHDDYFDLYTPFVPLKHNRIKPTALFKLLQCLQYNLDDHQDKALDDIVNNLAQWIITKTEQYNATKWGDL